MNRAGYDEEGAEEHYAMWRGQVASAIRGRRGQAFLKELVAALDAMPVKELIADELEKDGQFCALGCIGRNRGIDLTKLDPEDPVQLASTFGIAHQLVREIEYMNDAPFSETTASRWQSMRAWALRQIVPDESL